MGVMAARMHAPRVLAAVGQPLRLLNRQAIHVSTQAHCGELVALLALALLPLWPELCQYAMLGHGVLEGDAQRLQLLPAVCVMRRGGDVSVCAGWARVPCSATGWWQKGGCPMPAAAPGGVGGVTRVWSHQGKAACTPHCLAVLCRRMHATHAMRGGHLM